MAAALRAAEDLAQLAERTWRETGCLKPGQETSELLAVVRDDDHEAMRAHALIQSRRRDRT